jgi:hypothetical protein
LRTPIHSPCEPIPDLNDVGALVDEREGQAALLTAVATGGRASKLLVPLIAHRHAQKKCQPMSKP